MKALLIPMALVLCFGLTACDDDDSPAGPSATGGVTVSLSAKALVSPARAEGDLVLTRARFLLRDLKLDQVNAPEETEFVTGPFIVDLDLAGTMNELVVTQVPADTYDEVRFKIHKLDDDDPRDRQALQNPVFAEFAGSDRYSVIVEGTWDDGNGASAFTFVSDLNEEQRVPLIPPIALSADDAQVNVTLVIDTSQWFSGGPGNALDPRSSESRDQIEENIANSIDIFEDRDRDGRRDEDDESSGLR